jgi:hypothetical protein
MLARGRSQIEGNLTPEIYAEKVYSVFSQQLGGIRKI